MAAPVRDMDFFEQLLEPYRAEMRLRYYHMTGSLQDAEDLVQETFLHAWRSWPEFEGRSSYRWTRETRREHLSGRAESALLARRAFVWQTAATTISSSVRADAQLRRGLG